MTMSNRTQSTGRPWARRLWGGLLVCLMALQAGVALGVERVVYYHTDALGSPVAATNEQGAIVWREEYQPYGERLLKQDGGANTLWFTGKPEEERLGINYFGARWYDPTIGQFLAVDPAGPQESNPHSFNRYAYANNNPYKFVDPNGNSPLDVGLFIADSIRFTLAVYSGNPQAIASAAMDLAASTIGLASPVPGTGLAIKAARATDRAVGAAKAIEGIKTPYGIAKQSDDAAALAARAQVEEGATLYRTGTTGKSQAAEAQFWSLEHPLSPGFAQRYGIPA